MCAVKTLSVELGSRSYPIYIGNGLLNNASYLSSHLAAKQVLIVTNDRIAPLYLEKVKRLFSGQTCHAVVLPDGEKHKNLETVNLVFDTLIREKHSRTTTLVALGGGVIGDMTGFAAACYQRGVAFMQIPTTLLAQVDSSVGGKTGVNHPLGKNMIGAFHQPECVLIDVETLNTLPDREYRSGLAEVIKYGLINDKPFYEWLQENADLLLQRNSDALVHAIECSCSNKANIVAVDEKEMGVRALLNYGHTFGHAIEAWQNYTGYLHGEAIAIGSVIAAELSVSLGLLSQKDGNAVRTIMARLGLPTCAPAGMTADDFIEFMQRDKKILDGSLRLILLEAIGKAVIKDSVPIDLIKRAIDACREDVGR